MSSSRSARQAEIDAIMAEMMSTAPAVKHHPSIKVNPGPAPEFVEGAVVVGVDSESDSEEDGEANELPKEAQSAVAAATDRGEVSDSDSDDFGPQPMVAASQDQDDRDIVEDYAIGKRIPVSHQVIISSCDL